MNMVAHGDFSDPSQSQHMARMMADARAPAHSSQPGMPPPGSMLYPAAPMTSEYLQKGYGQEDGNGSGPSAPATQTKGGKTLKALAPAPPGGGGGSITIDNNTDGNVLTATGEGNRIEGLTNFKYDGALTASTDLYISGSGNNLFINGTDATGSLKRYEIKVVGGRLVVQMDPE